jgi:hypothetical protein
VSYVLKHINHPNGDWTCGKLELFLPPLTGVPVSKRMRRRLRRHRARQQQFGTSTSREGSPASC